MSEHGGMKTELQRVHQSLYHLICDINVCQLFLPSVIVGNLQMNVCSLKFPKKNLLTVVDLLLLQIEVCERKFVKQMHSKYLNDKLANFLFFELVFNCALRP